jgi:competence protein ComFA
LNYELTKNQKEASEFILSCLKNKKDCVLSAVTGSGKTEIIYDSLKYCVQNGLKVGVVIPRKDVVIELCNRIKNDFKDTFVVGVYGGCHDVIYGDIIVLTSHQLYRYNQYFDLIIIDEVDAFPYKNNKMLEHFLKRSLKGNVVYMSATVSDEIKVENKFSINRRYHGYKLDVPKVKYLFFKYEIKKFLKRHKEDLVLIYFPTIKEENNFSKKLKTSHYVINSKVKNREELLLKLHDLKKGIILTTLVLERGITFENCHVIVYRADHNLFSWENLVQISGRVGRKKSFPCGEILFLANNKTKSIKKAIGKIKRANE